MVYFRGRKVKKMVASLLKKGDAYGSSLYPWKRSRQVSNFEAIQLMIAFATLVLLIIGHKDQKK